MSHLFLRTERGIVRPWPENYVSFDCQAFTSFTGSSNSSHMPAFFFLYMCIYYVGKTVLILLTLRSPSLRDKPARRVGSGGAGGHGDVHLSGCRSANTHHHLETQLGTHSCQRQVGLMRNPPPRWLCRN